MTVASRDYCFVMAGLVPAIHVFVAGKDVDAGTGPGMMKCNLAERTQGRKRNEFSDSTLRPHIMIPGQAPRMTVELANRT